MFGLGGFDREPPAWHLPETTDSRPYAEGPFPPKLDCDKAKGLVTRWHQCKFCSTEDKRRDWRELGFGVDSAWVSLHDLFQFQRGKLAMVVNSWPHTDQLDVLVFFYDTWEDICYEIDAFLEGPAAHKHE